MELDNPQYIIFKLFKLLHKKSPHLKNREIRIPDTVIIETEPIDWYFTNKQGQIKKKMRNKLTPEKILEEFKRKTKGHQITAKLITLSRSKTPNNSTRSLRNKKIINLSIDPEPQNQKVEIAYLTSKQLSKSIYIIKA